MTVDSASDASPGTVRCHACGARGSGRGSCTACGMSFGKRHKPGTMLGSYQLHDIIGEGGMGIVYSATHARLGRRVAIKMLRTYYTNNPQAVHRFFAEARAVNKIQHPNIVEITDFIEQPGADNYYVMELLQGTNLAHLVEREGVLPMERTIGIAMQVASVLEAVHRAGIVHRDVKPENVFLAERGGQSAFVKLVDFGVAKLLDENDDFVSIHNTNPGAILGTPDYMSPEQASGNPVDHRTDIYAFGAMLYKLVTGRLPLVGDDFGEMVVQLRTVEPPSPRSLPVVLQEIPQALDDLIMSCLAKRTIDRPDSMETVSERLAEIADDQGWIVYELNIKSSGETPRPSAEIKALRISEERKAIKGSVPPPFVRRQTEREGGDSRESQPPARSRALRPIVAMVGAALAIAVVAIVLVVRGSGSKPAGSDDVSAKVQAQLALADERITAGRLVATGGDDALEHLLAARKLDPGNAAVRDRLHALAQKYQQLADQALAAGSLAEAAAHLQVVIDAEPDNAAAKQQLEQVEAQVLARQRAKH